MEGTRLLQEYGAGETPQALAPRRLAATPAESEVPGVPINIHMNRYIKNEKCEIFVNNYQL
jgi:hypothetical protein